MNLNDINVTVFASLDPEVQKVLIENISGVDIAVSLFIIGLFATFALMIVMT